MGLQGSRVQISPLRPRRPDLCSAFFLLVMIVHNIKPHRIYLFLILWTLGGCSHSPEGPRTFQLDWQAIDSLNAQLPPSITVYFSENRRIPVRAWLVKVQPDSMLDVQVVVSEDQDRRETPQEFADRLQAAVIINGGYFLMDQTPTSHVGLVKSRGRIVEHTLRSIIRDRQRYFVSRGAVGFDSTDHMDIAWITEKDDVLYALERPIPNASNRPAEAGDVPSWEPWNPSDALQAGPVLIADGKMTIPVEEEAFFHTSIPKVHPRTAVGYDTQGNQYYLVVDGRQPQSRGMYLEELARTLLDLGCVEGLNLDGGGSSAIIVRGTLLNRPAGSTQQREVMSAIAIMDRNE
ncbi:MAG: phosphodiester glycosidase family protein [Candidatus Neomarinimicrobiota bacterium]|nr:MAG: phosphodiester glycosidase family protein [Candidatus Neomarinimicrobiota bacterium]